MTPAATAPNERLCAAADVPLESCDEWSDRFDSHPRYCPTQLLAGFTLLMAGHGRCVSADMMLGDREYAMWQLARARTIDDAELRTIASRLFGWFDERGGAAAQQPHAAAA